MKLKITVHGVAYEVDVEVLDAKDEMARPTSPLPAAPPVPSQAASTAPAPPPHPTPGPAPAGDGSGIGSPIAGTVLEVKVAPGDVVTEGQPLLIIEAMKMETAIAAPGAGTIKAVLVAAGDGVRENQTLIEFA
jgi:biotin carboxyl carrier protein